MRIYRHLTANTLVLQAFPFQRELAMEAYLSENEDVFALDDDALSEVELIDAKLSIKRLSQNSVESSMGVKAIDDSIDDER